MACRSWSPPSRSNLTELTTMGVSLAAFSGGKGLSGPQCTELVSARPSWSGLCACTQAPRVVAAGG